MAENDIVYSILRRYCTRIVRSLSVCMGCLHKMRTGYGVLRDDFPVSAFRIFY